MPHHLPNQIRFVIMAILHPECKILWWDMVKANFAAVAMAVWEKE